MTYAKEKGIEHHRLKANGRERFKGIYHIQNVNSYHSRLKSWMKRFNSVATKYLDHYLSWFQFLDTIKHIKDNFTITKMFLDSCSFSVNTTYDKLKISEFSE